MCLLPLYIQVKALTQFAYVLIICGARELPEVFASSLFLPTFFITESLSLHWMSGPRGNTLGDGRRRTRDTGLLNIAGEKIEDSGTLGFPC